MRATLKRLICLILIFTLIFGTLAVADTDGEPENYEPLRYGMSDNDGVRAMQRRLAELGYFRGGATGGYYGVTADAVAAFQKMAGLEETPKLASAELLKRLFAADAPTVNGGVFMPTPVPTEEPADLLKFGLKDSDGVRQVQKRLEDLGYFYSSITGNFFGATQSAIEEFQRRVGLPVNGKVVDEQTLAALYSESAPGRNDAPSATVTPLPTATPRPVITPAPDATPRPALRYGETSKAVEEMQERLKELKYFRGGATGSYWQVTVEAVAAFQEDAGLPVNGRLADTATLELMFSEKAPIKGGPASLIPELTTLYFGQSGSAAVRRMQDRLRELGYFDDVSTGGYYLMTAQAVADFQAAAGMAVNGNTASVEMLKALFADDAPVFGESRPTAGPTATAEPTMTAGPTATAEPTMTAGPTATAEPTMTAGPTATVEPTMTAGPTATVRPESAYAELTYGMTDSDAVRRLQARLQEKGYLDVDPTGGYWSMTAKAVKQFLKDNGMTGNGKTATAQMQRLLFEGESADDRDEPVQHYKTLRYGTNGNADVKAMQARLRALGYFDQSPTGNYFGITADAVESFQKAAGLPVDRNSASPELQALLFSADAPAFGETAVPPSEEETPEQPEERPEISYDYQPLSYGTQNSDAVRAMQEKLREKGFLSARPTGGYFTETRRAVAAFQEYAKLPVNGRLADAETLAYLFYTGDLDALIAGGGFAKPGDGENQPDDETGSEEAPGFDADKYAGADRNQLLYRGDSGEQVNYLIMRLKELGYLEGKNPDQFDADVVAAVKWFQNTNLLDADGVAGPKTLAALYSVNAISADDSMKDNISSGDPVEVEGEEISANIGAVQNIDWFSAAGDSYYNRRSGQFRDGSVAIITDVSTGRSFRVKRSGGYNHADVEPLTAFDTWVMYEIYDKEWSWKRHAVYVTLSSGVTLAGSMNGMPHGSGSISDNNFDGHICIHFLNSRTHGSDKVDPDHQAAVSKAAGR